MYVGVLDSRLSVEIKLLRYSYGTTGQRRLESATRDQGVIYSCPFTRTRNGIHSTQVLNAVILSMLSVFDFRSKKADLDRQTVSQHCMQSVLFLFFFRFDR